MRRAEVLATTRVDVDSRNKAKMADRLEAVTDTKTAAVTGELKEATTEMTRRARQEPRSARSM
jgi:hypothetical protein